jgi:hypothetical protein
MNFSEKYLQFGRTPSKMFACPVQGQKILKYISFKGHQIISLPMAPICLGLALPKIVVHFYVFLQNYYLCTVTYWD